jgi:hypothetical protein
MAPEQNVNDDPADTSLKEGLSIDTNFYRCWFSRDTIFKLTKKSHTIVPFNGSYSMKIFNKIFFLDFERRHI